MSEMNRRKFLIASVGAAGLVSGTLALTLPELLKSAENRPRLDDDSGILVLVTLYGGNDGLSTVIPYTDGVYHDRRPDLAYAPADVLPLDDRLGLNPGLTGMAQMWNDKSLAIVRGVSYPKPDRSHFRSMDIWQTASPSGPTHTGWIGRWLDATGTDPLRAVNIGTVLPPMLVGEKNSAASLMESYSPMTEDVAATMDALSAGDANDTDAMTGVRESYSALRVTDRTFGPLFPGADPTTAALGPIAGGLVAPRPGDNPLAKQLKLVATCIKAAVPTRVYAVSLGGFDTHANERKTQQTLLRTVDDAVTPFLQELRMDKHGKDVVVVLYTEFGRRVSANASQGTDHGAAGPVLIAGVPVKGGFYGDEPSLTDLDNGDLKGTTDFRDIYHELLSKTLKTDPGPSVGDNRRDIGFL
ncbi:DUF1501 domain-containing protein [Mycolicibacterium moriokaense]|uniref:Uncharacterized protein (DUF1501 family) n=1 Tax=Mycolicibacterium moriokaense TaxID=39691 RepID=A0A318HA15_9MYCO|nr:DUF1501 domain-containing protein [Mycolicibacterium moriokaense]PXW99132.1 uncharacterized protein (DUF1501 family) [Mycolicibacterium moriokaense]